ncbi:FimV/HubP family polar landmark protein [Marinomonas fungiae]|uniref:FimV/HubP family polar landmark protein n=1 Tax=Marinomonas fungiae TaxID=1137284 RepID=UPI003A8E0115
MKQGEAQEEDEFAALTSLSLVLMKLLLMENSSDDDDEEPIDFFDASGDEVATKLDLARAYMDMGDEEGARVILEDVINAGNESQVAEASSMMERMFPSE